MTTQFAAPSAPSFDPIPTVKGEPVMLVEPTSSAGRSDYAVDCREANAVNFEVYCLSGSGSCDVTVLGSDEEGGFYIALPDLNATQTGLTQNTSFSVSAGQRFVRVQLANVTGIWIVWATPYVSPGQSRVSASISVANLSAISADLGTVTAGSIVIGTTNKLWLNDAGDGGLAIGGAVKAAAPFRVSNTGALTATNATITGTVTATSGAIGGWTLGATALTSGSGASTVGLDSGGSNPALYAGSATPGSAPFRVTNAGALTATNATITGAITATSGSIGSFTIGTYLYTGAKTAYNDANAGVHVGSDGIGIGSNVFTVSAAGALTATSGTIGGFTIAADFLTVGSGITRVVVDGRGVMAFYAGADDYNAAPFHVTVGGALTATNATITGAITATSGSIGSFTIGTYLYTGAKTAYNDANAGVHVGSDGIGIGNNVFTVSSAGALVATSATITGAITASSGSFSGVINIGTSGGIFQGTGTFASPTTALKIHNSTGVGLLEMWGSGIKQVYMTTGGILAAGAGGVTLDSNGVWIDAQADAATKKLGFGGTAAAPRAWTTFTGNSLQTWNPYSSTLNATTTVIQTIQDGTTAAANSLISSRLIYVNVVPSSGFPYSALEIIGSPGPGQAGFVFAHFLGIDDADGTFVGGLALFGNNGEAATSGILRLPNAQWIAARNDVNLANVNLLRLNSSNQLEMGDTTTLYQVASAMASDGDHYVRGGPANASYSSTAQTLYTKLSANQFGVINQPSGHAVGLLGINEDSAATNTQFYGLVGAGINRNTTNAKQLVAGVQGEGVHLGAGAATSLVVIGSGGVAINQSAYAVGALAAIFASSGQNNAGGSVATNYGVYIQPQTVGSTNYDIFHEGTTPNIGIGNTGTLTWKDAAGNTLMSLADVGTTGNLAVTGGISIAGTVAAGVTGLGADAANGNMQLNVATSKAIAMQVNGVTIGALSVNGLGIGGTPVAPDASAKTLQVGARFIMQSVVGAQTLTSYNAYYDGSSWKYAATAVALGMRMNAAAGAITFHLAASGTAGNTITNWDGSDIRMTIGTTTLTLTDPYDLVVGTSTGTKIGTATNQKIGFHNATPVIQRAGAAQAAVATTAATQTTPWGFSTQAQADAIVTLVNELRAAVVEKGLIKGAA